jgi:Tfp pilus assembly protein PilN
MIKINLLPPEIIEKRKWERFYPYVLIGAAICIGIVVVMWAALQFSVSSRRSELQSIQQNSAQLRQQADALQVFELTKAGLARRQAASDAALLGRVNMGRLAEEVSLVLPDPVWVNGLTCSQSNGLKVSLFAPDPFGTDQDEGYKAAAMTVVRLGSLDALSDVWLEQAAAGRFTAYQGAGAGSVDASAGVLVYEVTADINPGATWR